MDTKFLRAGMLAVAAAAIVAAPAAAAPDKPIKVSGDGSGWQFNRDASNATPYSMSLAQRTIGGGSLYVEPIPAVPGAKKFIAEQFLASPAADLQSISVDFLIAGSGTALDATDFYVNVYTLLPNTTQTFFDCRFDYIATSGSTTQFTTLTVNPAALAPVTTRAGSPPCPATLSAMPAGTTIPFFSINVGQTNGGDAGLAAYLDNVVVAQTGGTTTYDLDPTKDACKDGGFAVGGYKNQGACIAAVN
jgi:hypothetical protein